MTNKRIRLLPLPNEPGAWKKVRERLGLPELGKLLSERSGLPEVYVEVPEDIFL